MTGFPHNADMPTPKPSAKRAIRRFLREENAHDIHSQAELAAAAGVARTTINGIYNGRDIPSPELAAKLAEITGYSFAEFRPDIAELVSR